MEEEEGEGIDRGMCKADKMRMKNTGILELVEEEEDEIEEEEERRGQQIGENDRNHRMKWMKKEND